jgi:hypothetical protein
MFSGREIFFHTMMLSRADRIPWHAATVYTRFFQFYTVWDVRAFSGEALQMYTRKKKKKQKAENVRNRQSRKKCFFLIIEAIDIFTYAEYFRF